MRGAAIVLCYTVPACCGVVSFFYLLGLRFRRIGGRPWLFGLGDFVVTLFPALDFSISINLAIFSAGVGHLAYFR